MHQINPTDAQRIDRRDDERGLCVGLHRGGPVWPLLPGEAAHAATDVDESTQPNTAPRIPRWNEAPDYPHFGEGEPGVSPSWYATTWAELAKFTSPFWMIGIGIIAALLAVHYWPR